MEKKDLKKSWVTPELIVLVRNKTEEAVLLVCKSFEIVRGPDYTNDDCQSLSTLCSGCNVDLAS